MTEQYFMRTTGAKGRAHGGFQWPMEVGAIVTAPDWNPEPVCGGGLHGLLNGGGDATHLSFDPDAIWWIVAATYAVDLEGKHKFKSCRVVAFGARDVITQEMHRLSHGAPVHGLIASSGDYATLTGGDYATLTGGDGATLTGGYRATLTGGDYATLVFTKLTSVRRLVLTAYVGDDGILPRVPYRASDDFKSVIRADEAAE